MAAQAKLTFTPRARGKLDVTVDFNGAVDVGGDWSLSGNYVSYKVFRTQGGSTAYGQEQRMSTTRLKYAAQEIFDVSANQEVECGLELAAHGISRGAAYEITITARLLKETSS